MATRPAPTPATTIGLATTAMPPGVAPQVQLCGEFASSLPWTAALEAISVAADASVLTALSASLLGLEPVASTDLGSGDPRIQMLPGPPPVAHEAACSHLVLVVAPVPASARAAGLGRLAHPILGSQHCNELVAATTLLAAPHQRIGSSTIVALAIGRTIHVTVVAPLPLLPTAVLAN